MGLGLGLMGFGFRAYGARFRAYGVRFRAYMGLGLGLRVHFLDDVVGSQTRFCSLGRMERGSTCKAKPAKLLPHS